MDDVFAEGTIDDDFYEELEELAVLHGFKREDAFPVAVAEALQTEVFRF